MNKKIVISIIAIILFILVSVGTFVFFKYFKKSDQVVNPTPNESVEPIYIQPSPIDNKKGEYNILLLGQGDPGHEGSGLTDSMMVLNINTNKKSSALIFIPRDIYATLPQKVNGISAIKINEVYSLGIKNSNISNGLKLVEQTVSTIIGQPIQYSILIDFNGFTQVIDALGGIDITVNKTFDDYYYPIAGKELENCGKTNEELAAINATMSGFQLEKQYTCRYEHLHFNVGKTKVNGATALKFARSRHSSQDGSDFARGMRQQSILLGIKDKLISIEALKNIDKLFAKFIKLLKTDLDLDSTKAISSLIINPKEYKVSQIVLSEENMLTPSKTPSGQFILIPKAGENNWKSIQNFISEELKK